MHAGNGEKERGCEFHGESSSIVVEDGLLVRALVIKASKKAEVDN